MVCFCMVHAFRCVAFPFVAVSDQLCHPMFGCILGVHVALIMTVYRLMTHLCHLCMYRYIWSAGLALLWWLCRRVAVLVACGAGESRLSVLL